MDEYPAAIAAPAEGHALHHVYMTDFPIDDGRVRACVPVPADGWRVGI